MMPAVPVPVDAAPPEAAPPETTPDDAIIDGRRRPGFNLPLPDKVTQDNKGAIQAPPPEAFPPDSYDYAVPDRWRLMKTLCGTLAGDPTTRGLCGPVGHTIRDPYHQNVLKGDRPLCIATKEENERRKLAGIARCATPGLLHHDDWFLVVNLASDTVIEPRSFPIPVGVQTTSRPGSLDVFGRSQSFVAAQTFLAGFDLFKGSTAYKPPEIEYKVQLAYQINYADVPERRILNVRPSRKNTRYDQFFGVQEAFIDYHIRNTSARYDFDSIRIGIQPFQQDFRGFLFQDSQLGIRLFGNRDDNRWQYNLAAFRRLEKDTNSGLNSVTKRPRDDYVFAANAYRQDFPVVGLTSEVSLTYNLNREGGRIEVDTNGFPVRPALLGDLRGRDYDIVYVGYSMDGHIGRINLTGSFYGAFGEDRNSFFTSRATEVRAFFAAVEPSIDLDWVRLRASALYATGDKNPYDNRETGFDAIFENPVFAGADTSYWIRQSIPFAGGGRAIGINGRNGILNSLRSSKEQGQSNFNNPGTILAGVGFDADVTPKFRLSGNLNHLWFENTATLQALRSEGSIPRSIGYDASLAAIVRPKAIQNVVFRLSGAVLQPSKGFKDLFTNSRRDGRYYSVLFNAIVSY
ncbi:hypothetical protein [Sphingomonas antarctica]|uniref:hypothetical protein n=1 Tax=Sphingomonas antarctica TaxID=2040274 RepID=UPI0039EBA84B